MNHRLIPFNRPYISGAEIAHISEAISSNRLSGDGPFTRKAQAMLEQQLAGAKKVLLTTSCTHALEMAAILLDLEPGDEVIVPSFAFVTTALAFAMHGAKIVFADVRADTLNLDETRLDELVTAKTRAVVPLHYAGVGCEMDAIVDFTDRHGLVVIEDNALGLYGTYRDRFLGTWGHMAAQSFHETKNIVCGEGGAIIINDPKYIERAEIVREKGTNRARFFRGQVDKYTWVDKGSSYVISDILAAFLCSQLEHAAAIQGRRDAIWRRYFEGLRDWAEGCGVQLPTVPEQCKQPYHMFYMLLPSHDARTRLIEHLDRSGISAVFHYLPLHQSAMGKKFQARTSQCPVTEYVSERLLRLPLFNDLSENDQERVISTVTEFTP